jgi:photosynthetic reaction center H subunit
MTATFFGTVDLAQVTLYLFWIFFAGLVIYLQRENSRDGYPTQNEDGSDAGATFGIPEPKAFILGGGRGTVYQPNDWKEDRTFAMERTAEAAGSPYEPTGANPMLDGVGPGAYAMREDEPERDGHGRAKIQPMRSADEYVHFAGSDPRGMPVIAGDGEIVGTISDMWVDVPEALVRYLEVDLGSGDARLIPMPLARITWKGVQVRSIFGEHFKNVPTIRTDGVVTKLEEEKISAYYASGVLYASKARFGPRLEAAEA